MIKLDEYEADILKSVESGEWKSRGDIAKRKKELQSILKNQKKKAISIRVSENDIYALKKKALEKWCALSKHHSNAHPSIRIQ